MKIILSPAKTLLFVCALSFTFCKKEKKEETPTPVEEKIPSADFNFKKTQYRSGDTIILINLSTDAETYRWTMPDGQTSKLTNPSFLTSELPVDQTLAFTLEAFSKSGSKSDYAVKTITIAPGEGNITLYLKTNSLPMGGYIVIDGKTMGTSSFTASSEPLGCGAPGYPTYTLKVGNHTVEVNGGVKSYSQTILVKANKCIVLQMDK